MLNISMYYRLLDLRVEERFVQNNRYETSCSDRTLISRKFARLNKSAMCVPQCVSYLFFFLV